MLIPYQAHLQSQNYVEAALTLKLHSDLHDWDLYSFVPPMEDLGLPQQSQFHRKETLCLLILDYLGPSMIHLGRITTADSSQARGKRMRVQSKYAKNWPNNMQK
jgi:hypothetical protein